MMVRNYNKNRRGLTSVEFALILPILLFMILGIIEIGTMFYSWMTVQKAAQVGARFAASGVGEEQGTRLAQIVGVTEDWLTTLNKGAKEITVSSWPTATASGDPTTGYPGGPCQLMEVAVSYKYKPFTPFLSALLPDTVTLEGTDRKLNEPWKPCEEPL